MAKVQFGSLYPTTLGFDRMFNDLEAMLDSTINHTAEKFPPHNIIKLDEYKYTVELAVAGFDEDEIDITVEDGLLTIKGEKTPNDEKVNYCTKVLVQDHSVNKSILSTLSKYVVLFIKMVS